MKSKNKIILGNSAKIFFSHEKRNDVLQLYKTKDEAEKNDLATILQNLSVILRLLGSRELIKVEEFGQFCLDTYVLMRRTFPWMKVNQSIHQYLGHGHQIIAMNDNRGLGQLSEAPLESCHKVLRRVRQNLSRMTSLDDNLTDNFGRLWMLASPQVRV